MERSSAGVPLLVVEASSTVDIGSDGRDYPVLPERLVRIDGVDFVVCDLHGLIPLLHECSSSPADHWCRSAAHPNWDPEDGDQCCSHAESSRLHGMLLFRLSRLHARPPSAGDDCPECGCVWPCRTAHLTAGWGERTGCEDAGWCEHANVALG